MLSADPNAVSARAKKRGLPQLGTLGAGNHYAEIQVVDEIFDKPRGGEDGPRARRPGLCDDPLRQLAGWATRWRPTRSCRWRRRWATGRDLTNDRQLACARIALDGGPEYLAAMAAAANYAWVNRSSMTFLCRQAFAKQFSATPDDLDMAVVYDVSHNIAKVEEHLVDGKAEDAARPPQGLDARLPAAPPAHPRRLPVHRGSRCSSAAPWARARTCSRGPTSGMAETFGSTCHGAGRAKSRAGSRRQMDYTEVLDALQQKGISIRVASPEARDGGEPRELQGRDAGGRDVPPGGHLEEVRQAAADRGDQGIARARNFSTCQSAPSRMLACACEATENARPRLLPSGSRRRHTIVPAARPRGRPGQLTDGRTSLLTHFRAWTCGRAQVPRQVAGGPATLVATRPTSRTRSTAPRRADGAPPRNSARNDGAILRESDAPPPR